MEMIFTVDLGSIQSCENTKKVKADSFTVKKRDYEDGFEGADKASTFGKTLRRLNRITNRHRRR